MALTFPWSHVLVLYPTNVPEVALSLHSAAAALGQVTAISERASCFCSAPAPRSSQGSFLMMMASQGAHEPGP